MNSQTIAARLKLERERLGFTLEQFAVLSGVDATTYRHFELGDFYLPVDFIAGLSGLGCDSLFIGTGERRFASEIDPKTPPKSSMFCGYFTSDDDFRNAVNLMRRSAQAVDAFMGTGCAEKAPELVAALMNATLVSGYQSGPGEREDITDKIVGAIGDLVDAIRESHEEP